MKHQNPLSEENIAAMVDAFLDGATTPAQEERLYAFFRNSPQGSLSAELEAYRPMFAWYSALKVENKAARKPSFWSRYRYAGVACVTAVLVAGASIIFKNASSVDNPLYAQYDGSYVIRDGCRINDMEQIFNSVLAAERLADSLETVAAREEEMLSRDYDRILVETALSNVNDKALAKELKNELIAEPQENQ